MLRQFAPKAMARRVKVGVLFRYLFLYSLLGYSAFLAIEGQLEASGAVLGGSVGLFSLQKLDDDASPEHEQAIDELRLKLLETQSEVEYYKYKLIESDLRSQYQGVVNQNVLEINDLKHENHEFAETVSQEQDGNSAKAKKISYLESENNRLREQISKMEKERIFKMKRSVLTGMDGGKAAANPASEPDVTIAKS